MRVKISASQRVRYSQEVDITREEWEQLNKINEDDMCGNGGHVSGMLDLMDVFDADDFEDVEIELVDEKGEVIDVWNPDDSACIDHSEKNEGGSDD